MAEKRFYWLKLKEDYFNNPKIKKLRKIAGGDTFTIIYLKMQLLSVSNKGIIEFEGIEPTIEEELALKLDEDLDNVEVTLNYLKMQGLVETNNNEFLLLDACKNIGSECDSAERVRLFREREKQKSLQCNESVTEVLQSSISISNSISKSNNKENIIKEIINYLNTKAKTNYSYKTKKTVSFINGRIEEGYTLEQFKQVIDKKCNEWIDTDMEKYLTPDTLFRPSNFEKYLNQKILLINNKSLDNDREYSDAELNSLFDDISKIDI